MGVTDVLDETYIIGDVEAFFTTLEQGVFAAAYTKLLAEQQRFFAQYMATGAEPCRSTTAFLDASEE